MSAAGLLEDRVVVISGVGPGLGSTLALRCASHGADVVLAARTRERLEKVAAEVEALGRRALPVPTDITDDDSVSELVDAAEGEFGHVDTLVNNAFSVPSMKPLANTDFQQIRDSVELTVLAALRLTRSFTPALTESDGSVVNINSMVLRHSQERYGSYKLAKSALLAMSQSLATELGPHGVRVNSVAPGYIWGPTLRGYFEHQAGKYGTTVEQIYEHTAAASDLRRLPTTEEIADTVIFLASPMASAITGQCIDVNCGEYHH
ncbi:SDR family oxidoreductase [Rhodococcus sp. BL-253-APC-6A1W]|uniref:SDR family oxidoreductase n=1 Tax=Rhodococcus sp. BL-253-APC-6A1W TaxID=2725307 RepID=UPI00146A6240|nr:SDR family oxidoreductase [Rhodococcus sp. BL-253-APC-6A1W]NMD97194.1 SDR family oxidoreductase [Rhodococcus sp. BL-253-APC-6A1W]